MGSALLAVIIAICAGGILAKPDAEVPADASAAAAAGFPPQYLGEYTTNFILPFSSSLISFGDRRKKTEANE